MNTRTLLYAFFALRGILAAAANNNNEPESADTVDELVESIRSMRLAEIDDVLGRICETGRYELIEMLLSQPPVYWRTGGAGPVVAWAVQHGHPDAARAVVSGMFERKQQELEKACRLGSVELVESLLADPDVDPAANDNAALIEACAGGHVPVVERLCATGRVNPIANRFKPIHMAIDHDRFDLLRYMLEQSANGPHKFIRQITPSTRMPIHRAMMKGRLESLVVLMERDQEAHTRLEGGMLKGLVIDVTWLGPDTLRAAIAGDLVALMANTPNPFHSLDEIDVLLGLARHHQHVLAHLKERQQDYLATNFLPKLTHILDAVEGEQTLITLLRNLEAKETYGFLVGRQLKVLAAFLARIRSSRRLDAERLARTFGGRLPNGFKNID